MGVVAKRPTGEVLKRRLLCSFALELGPLFLSTGPGPPSSSFRRTTGDNPLHTPNWPRAVETNRDALLRVVAVLFFMAGLDEVGADFVPRRVWRMILRLLRPAESAARRLIVAAARGIAVAPPKPRAERPPTSAERLQARGLLVIHENVNLGLARAPWSAPAEPPKPEPRIPAFPLADPPRRFDPRDWNGLRPFPTDGFAPADGDEEVSAARLCRRLRALKRALDDLPGQAQRLARREARREAWQDMASRPIRSGYAPASKAPLKGAYHGKIIRLGHPPGHRRRGSYVVDDILRECHALALSAREPPDSS